MNRWVVTGVERAAAAATSARERANTTGSVSRGQQRLPRHHQALLHQVRCFLTSCSSIQLTPRPWFRHRWNQHAVDLVHCMCLMVRSVVPIRDAKRSCCALPMLSFAHAYLRSHLVCTACFVLLHNGLQTCCVSLGLNPHVHAVPTATAVVTSTCHSVMLLVVLYSNFALPMSQYPCVACSTARCPMARLPTLMLGSGSMLPMLYCPRCAANAVLCPC